MKRIKWTKDSLQNGETFSNAIHGMLQFSFAFFFRERRCGRVKTRTENIGVSTEYLVVLLDITFHHKFSPAKIVARPELIHICKGLCGEFVSYLAADGRLATLPTAVCDCMGPCLALQSKLLMGK